MLEYGLPLESLEKAFDTLKQNKGESLDEINVDTVRSAFDITKYPPSLYI